LLGRIQRVRRKPEAAAEAFNEVLKLNPRAVAAQLELSQISLTSGKPEAGLQYAEDAAKTLPGSPLIQLNLARNLIARREIARADPIVEQLVERYHQGA